MSTEVQLVTADDLLALPRGEFRYELINGELRKMSPTGHELGRITMSLSVLLGSYVKEERLGQVFAAETGFKLSSNPDTVRAPDIGFVGQRPFEELRDTRGFWPGPPDLAVEVLSPSDAVGEVEEKVAFWLKSGTACVWVVSPKLKTVTIYKSLSDIATLTGRDVLNGGDVVPGFSIQVAEIFSSE